MTFTVVLDRRSGLGSVRDQGDRPICLALAATTAHEDRRQDHIRLSADYLHYFASGAKPTNGVSFGVVAASLTCRGQPAELDCAGPGDGSWQSWVPAEQRNLFRRHCERRDPTPDAVADVLHSGTTPVLGISIPEPFFTPRSPWRIGSDGPVRGLHAVVAVAMGVDGNERQFLIRNSWGTSWGDAGHAWLDEDFLSKHLRRVMVLTKEGE